MTNNTGSGMGIKARMMVAPGLLAVAVIALGYMGITEESSATLYISIFAAIAGTTVSWIMSGAVSDQVNRVAEHLETIGGGDLTQTLGIVGSDEIGQMSQSIDQVTQMFRRTIQSINENSSSLSNTSTALTRVSGRMTRHAEDTAERANLVSSGAEVQSNGNEAGVAASTAGVAKGLGNT